MTTLKVPHTFEIRPTPPMLPAGLAPDELMIDLSDLPHGSLVELYFPELNAGDLAGAAADRYGSSPWRAVDANSLSCSAQEIVYLPIPVGANSSFAALLVATLPSDVRTGQRFTVNALQLTSALNGVESLRTGTAKVAEAVSSTATEPKEWSAYRTVLGTFTLVIPVDEREAILPTEERQFSILQWILSKVPRSDRNFLTFKLYVDLYGQRVRALGGDPDLIPPSESGTWPGWRNDGGRRCHHGRPINEECEHCWWEATGKIDAINFDHFGDFEGFVLETEDGEHLTYDSREEHVAALVMRAYEERLRITVRANHRHPRRPIRIMYRVTPI